MKHLLTILKKELKRVFTNPKLLLTVVFLPGILIFAMYSIMGNAMKNITTDDTEKTYDIYYVGTNPNEIKVSDDFTLVGILEMEEIGLKANFIEIQASELDTYKDKVKDKEVDFVVCFDDDFNSKVLSESEPTVTCYYNPTKSSSSSVHNLFSTGLNVYSSTIETGLYNNKQAVKEIPQQMVEEKEVMGYAIGMFMPFIIISLIFSSVTSIAPESIAGEKERGTMATLLVTPVSRTHIALGKILSLTIVSFVSALSSFIGIVFSLPTMLSGTSGETIDLNIYSFGDYLLILLVLLSLSVLVVGLVSITSAFAKNVKEASVLLTPIMLLSMAASMISIFTQSAPSNTLLYFIPLYNTISALQQIFSFSINYGQLAITVGSNLVYTIGIIFALTKMFESEKIMFSK